MVRASLERCYGLKKKKKRQVKSWPKLCVTITHVCEILLYNTFAITVTGLDNHRDKERIGLQLVFFTSAQLLYKVENKPEASNL